MIVRENDIVRVVDAGYNATSLTPGTDYRVVQVFNDQRIAELVCINPSATQPDAVFRVPTRDLIMSCCVWENDWINYAYRLQTIAAAQLATNPALQLAGETLSIGDRIRIRRELTARHGCRMEEEYAFAGGNAAGGAARIGNTTAPPVQFDIPYEEVFNSFEVARPDAFGRRWVPINQRPTTPVTRLPESPQDHEPVPAAPSEASLGPLMVGDQVRAVRGSGRIGNADNYRMRYMSVYELRGIDLEARTVYLRHAPSSSTVIAPFTELQARCQYRTGPRHSRSEWAPLVLPERLLRPAEDVPLLPVASTTMPARSVTTPQAPATEPSAIDRLRASVTHVIFVENARLLGTRRRFMSGYYTAPLPGIVYSVESDGTGVRLRELSGLQATAMTGVQPQSVYQHAIGYSPDCRWSDWAHISGWFDLNTGFAVSYLTAPGVNRNDIIRPRPGRLFTSLTWGEIGSLTDGNEIRVTRVTETVILGVLENRNQHLQRTVAINLEDVIRDGLKRTPLSNEWYEIDSSRRADIVSTAPQPAARNGPTAEETVSLFSETLDSLASVGLSFPPAQPAATWIPVVGDRFIVEFDRPNDATIRVGRRFVVEYVDTRARKVRFREIPDSRRQTQTHTRLVTVVTDFCRKLPVDERQAPDQSAVEQTFTPPEIVVERRRRSL